MQTARVVSIDDGPHGAARSFSTGSALRTEDFTLDGWLVQPTLNRLTRDGVSVHLRPQLVDLLGCLAARPGAVVTKAELVAHVWDGRYTVDTAIPRCISQLRSVLGDTSRPPRIIETITKRGYRLVAAVGPAPAAPRRRMEPIPASTVEEREAAAAPEAEDGADWQPPVQQGTWWDRVHQAARHLAARICSAC